MHRFKSTMPSGSEHVWLTDCTSNWSCHSSTSKSLPVAIMRSDLAGSESDSKAFEAAGTVLVEEVNADGNDDEDEDAASIDRRLGIVGIELLLDRSEGHRRFPLYALRCSSSSREALGMARKHSWMTRINRSNWISISCRASASLTMRFFTDV